MFFLASIPFEKHEVDDYERTRYRGFDQRIVDRREKRIIKKVLETIHPQKNEPSLFVLDVPCGYGRFSGLILEQGFRLISSDLSFYMVKRTIEKIEGQGFPWGVVVDLKQGLPFKAGSFGVVLSMRFFHHVHKPEEREAILREFARVSGKWIVLSFYQKNWLHGVQRKIRRVFKKSKTRIRMISSAQLKKEVGEEGLEVLREFPLFRGIHAQHIALLRKA